MVKRRSTPAKQMIHELIATAGTAVSQDYIEKALTGKMDRVTIYRVLKSFCEDGALHRVVGDDGKAYYALCSACSADQHRHDHAHFRCNSCLKIECLPYKTTPRLPDGYVMDHFNYWISGLCSSCG